MRLRTFTSLTILAIAFAFIAGCGDSDSPTSPTTSDFTPAELTTASTPPPNPQAQEERCDPFQDLEVKGMKNGRPMVENQSDSCHYIVLLAAYEMFNSKLDDQKLFPGWVFHEFSPREEFRFVIPRPDCDHQLDLVVGRNTPREPPFYTTQELLAFREFGDGENNPCTTSTPPPQPTPPQNLSCADITIVLGAEKTAEDANSITFKFSSNVAGIFEEGNSQIFQKNNEPRTETITFTADYEGLGCTETIDVFVSAKDAPEPSCDDIDIQLGAKVVDKDDNSITYKFSSNVAGSFEGGNPQTFKKGSKSRTETILFTAEGLGCTETIDVKVPAKDDDDDDDSDDDSCDDIDIQLGAKVVDKDDNSITYKFSSNVAGSFEGGNPQTFKKGSKSRTETILFTADYEGLGCTDTIDVKVPTKDDDDS